MGTQKQRKVSAKIIKQKQLVINILAQSIRRDGILTKMLFDNR